jgi:hypothetical protein
VIASMTLVLLVGSAQLNAPRIIVEAERAAGPYDQPAVPNPVLAVQRGGIRLPNGVDVALSIDTITAINGSVVLRTVTKIDEGVPRTMVFTPADGNPVILTRNGGEASSTMQQPSVTYDRQNGIRVIAGAMSMPVNFTVSNPARGEGRPSADGLEAIDPSMGVTTADGVVRTVSDGGWRAVELKGSDITITHLAGNAIGSVISNSGSDRAIDTLTNLSIDLGNAGPDVIGSAMLRVEAVSIEAMSIRY